MNHRQGSGAFAWPVSDSLGPGSSAAQRTEGGTAPAVGLPWQNLIGGLADEFYYGYSAPEGG